MIDIDKYLKHVFEKYTQTQEDFVGKSEYLEDAKRMVRSDFYDMDLEAENHYQRAIDKLNKDEFELLEKWLYQHPDNFNKERKKVCNEWLSEYEKEKKLNPFSEAYFINDNISLVVRAIGDSSMYAIVKSYIHDFEQIDFKELANLSGLIDFYNYLVSENEAFTDSEPDRVQNRIQFFFGKSEFVELVKSLIETKVVIGKTDKEVIEYFSKVLEFKIDADSFHDAAYQFKKRKVGSETPFITKLKTNLINSLQK